MSVPTPGDGPEESARYKRTIRAAEELFKKIGFRAVTMELVAREANVAKATLYSYFKNKDELYIAVCARMAHLLDSAVEKSLALPDETLDRRIGHAVLAKHRLVYSLVRKSPHAAELFTYTHSMAGDIFAELDVRILARLGEALSTDPQLAANAGQIARALYFGSTPLASKAASEAELDEDLAAFTSTYLAGARALAH
jgi:AcrR family transcriptional regulator